MNGHLIELGAEAASAGLVSASCGNASVRRGPASILITGSGCELGRLTELDLTEVNLKGEVLRGPRPSCELEMHLEVFRACPKAQAILHTHAPWSTLMACMKEPVQALDFIVEIPLFVGSHATVPFHPPGSRELALAVGQAFREPGVHLAQMRNHGQLAVGQTWREALHRVILFERACWMALQGHELERLPSHRCPTLHDNGALEPACKGYQRA